MDFVTRVPKVIGKYNSIFMVVDKLTNVTLLIPMKTTSIETLIAYLFTKEFVRLYDILARIISDCDAKFTSRS